MKFLLLTLALTLSFQTHALVVERMAAERDLDQAPWVVLGEVVRVDVETDPKIKLTQRFEVQIYQILRNSFSAPLRVGDTIRLKHPGGEQGNQGVLYPGFGKPSVGRKYQFYLKIHSPGYFRVAGWEKGILPLSTQRKFSRNRIDGSNGEGLGPFLFWDDRFFPIPYYLSAPTLVNHPDFALAIDKSFETWRNVSGTRYEFLPMGCSSTVQNENDGVNSIILMTNDWPFDPAAIAITRNFYNAGQSSQPGLIFDSDILLNAVDHQFTTTFDPEKYDLQDIVTHEVGHFLGMGHEAEPMDEDATMFASAVPGETKKSTLQSDDMEGIRSAYPGTGNRSSFRPASQSCELNSASHGCGAIHSQSSNSVLINWFLSIFSIVFLFQLLQFLLRLTRKSMLRKSVE